MSTVMGPEDRRGVQDGWSLYTLAAAALRYRYLVILFVAGGIGLGLINAFRTKPLATAKAAFVPQGRDESPQAGLAGLAARLAGGSGSESVEFYARLLQTRDVLRAVASDSFTSTQTKVREPLYKIWSVGGDETVARVDGAAGLLDGRTDVSISHETGIIELTVHAENPQLATEIADRMLTEVNRFNLGRRQSMATAERVFIEARLGEASESLAAAEYGLEQFLRDNREYGSSPSLRFQYDRLQRRLLTRQQVVTRLTDAAISARLEEVRNTPVIAVIQKPWASPAGPRLSMLRLLLYAIAGGIFGTLLAMLRYTGFLLGTQDVHRDALDREWAGIVRRTPDPGT